MAVKYEKIVAEDFARGVSTVLVTMPAGGQATGTQVGLHTWNGQYNIKDAGCAGDGGSDDRGDLNTLVNTVLQGAGGTIFIPPGVFHIGSNLTIPANVTLVFGQGGMLAPAAGVTVTIAGPIAAGPSQIFSLAAAGSAVAFAHVGGLPVTPVCYPEWWGINGNTGAFDTAAVQAAVNSGIPVKLARNYYVDTILIQTPTGVQCVFDGNGHTLIGVATVPRAAVVQFNAAYSHIDRPWIDGNFNTNYSCGWQHLGTNTNSGPVNNTIRSLWVSNILLAFVAGTPPSGTGSGTPVAADISETCYEDFFCINVQNGIYANATNIKLTFMHPRIIITDTGWTGTWNKDNTWCINCPPYDGTVGGAEIATVGGEIYNNEYGAHGQGIIGARITIDGAIWEVGGGNTIEGTSQSPRPYVVIRDLLDGGGPDGGNTYFTINANVTGVALVFEHCPFNQPSGSAGGHSLVDATAGGSANAIVIFRDCEIQEWVWDYTIGAANAAPLVNGCKAVFEHVHWYTLSPALDCYVHTNDGRPIFDTADGSFGSMSATQNQTTKNGWAWNGDATAGDVFGKETSDRPTFSADTAAMVVTSVGGGSSSVITPTGASGFKVRAGGRATDTLVLSGAVKTNAIGVGVIKVAFYQYDGSNSALTDVITVLGGDLTVLNFPNWIRFNARVPVPIDAQFAAISIQTTGGGVMKVAELFM